jgi:hypothetical protein
VASYTPPITKSSSIPQETKPSLATQEPPTRLNGMDKPKTKAEVKTMEKTNPQAAIIMEQPNSPKADADDSCIKQNGIDDGSTQISSDGSAKPPSFDTKSVASVTTFAMDEKESIRPDDSASVRAAIAEDEDLISAPGSVLAGSRVGSDLGTKAFQQQLHEIANISPLRAGDTPSNVYQGPTVMGTSRIPQPQTTDPNQLIPPSVVNITDSALPPNTPPDEKLLDALQSPRDRVWVLKLEQDVIDFITQSKYVCKLPLLSSFANPIREPRLTFPKCNGFYRMLAHRLADYYRLDHAIEQVQNGVAVVISRTSYSRLYVSVNTSLFFSNL